MISEIACPQWLVGTRYGSVMVFRMLFPLIMFVCLSVVALELRFFIISQAIAIGYAIMITRSLDLNWKMRALRLLPMFLLPLLSSITYFTLRGFTRMCKHFTALYSPFLICAMCPCVSIFSFCFLLVEEDDGSILFQIDICKCILYVTY